MDTDDLSNETYKAIFNTAEKFHHNLTLQFGLLASQCKNDDDYLKKANLLVRNWKLDLKGSLTEIFFDTPKPTASSLLTVLNNIENHINSTISIPIEERTFEF